MRRNYEGRICALENRQRQRGLQFTVTLYGVRREHGREYPSATCAQYVADSLAREQQREPGDVCLVTNLVPQAWIAVARVAIGNIQRASA